MISLKLDLESELNRCIENGGTGRTGGRYKGISEYPRSLCTVVMSGIVDGEVVGE